MTILAWDNSLDVKVEAMNRDHRAILDAMNAIHDAVSMGETGPAMNTRIQRLGEITSRHFADEEAFMRRTNFPDFETHQAIHRKLLNDFSDHAQRIASRGGKPGPDFFSFLRLWLSAHIKCIDRKYGDHASRKAA